jgi:hypothetical protein
MKANFEHIYEHIGVLFYAIASEHRKLNGVSYEKLGRLTEQQWYVSADVNSLEARLVECLQGGMRDSFNNTTLPDAAFGQFSTYFSIHNLPFGRLLRAKILTTAKLIASEFSGNAVKSDFICQLESMMQFSPIIPAS